MRSSSLHSAATQSSHLVPLSDAVISPAAVAFLIEIVDNPFTNHSKAQELCHSYHEHNVEKKLWEI